MGEAFIARGQTASKNVLDDIPVSGDYCSILVQLKDSAGKPCENTKINCKDGTRWYNYTTNETGYALFKCNSGSANITANNWINGSYIFDQDSLNTLNFDAPVGTKILKEVKFNKLNRRYYNSGSYSGQFRDTNYITNLIIVGGGGGGTGGYNAGGWGHGGGGGAKNYSSKVDIVKYQKYSISIGTGGRGVSYGENANSGGTSTAFGISANGGSGATVSKAGGGGIGLYNGGNGGTGSWGGGTSQGNGKDGKNGAGGGGGGGSSQYSSGMDHTSIGGNNGGGSGGIQSSWGGSGITGSGGGGGGGGQPFYSAGADPQPITSGGSGGSGRIEFNIF